MRKQITQAASIVQASRITPSRSSRTRSRRRPYSQLIVRSTAHCTFPRMRVSMPCLDPKSYDVRAYEAMSNGGRRGNIERLMLSVMV
jgi:hypothetical protein